MLIHIYEHIYDAFLLPLSCDIFQDITKIEKALLEDYPDGIFKVDYKQLQTTKSTLTALDKMTTEMRLCAM